MNKIKTIKYLSVTFVILSLVAYVVYKSNQLKNEDSFVFLKNPNDQSNNLSIKKSVAIEDSRLISKIENQSQIKNNVIASDSDVNKKMLEIQGLTKIAIQTPAKLKKLRALLSDPVWTDLIHQTLNDSKFLNKETFNYKLRMLDVFYEGLKFPDSEINDKYFELAETLMVEDTPPEIKNSSNKLKEYIGDRTEVAIVLLRAFPKEATNIENSVKVKNPSNLTVFENAKRLEKVYEVAL